MTTTNHTRTAARTNVQKASLAVGAVFLLVGILGFVPGITSNYESLQFAGHHSEAMLLGLFQVSALHNIVHLLFGAAGLLLARTATGAKSFLLYGGIVYLVLWVYGLVVDQESAGNFVPLNGFDNILHLLLGVGMIALAVLLTRGARDRMHA
jgi:membrane-bound ClpP family serine protease